MAQPAYPLRLPTRLPVLWRLTVLSLTLGALLSRVWAWLEGEPFRMAPPALILAMAVPLVLLWYVIYVARAGEAGLKLFDSWGFAHHVGWDEIRSAEVARWPHMLFAPALKVVLTDGRVRWLPRDIRGLAELHTLALRVAGPTHPLVRALETPLHRL
jgi:hypothetical protein